MGPRYGKDGKAQATRGYDPNHRWDARGRQRSLSAHLIILAFALSSLRGGLTAKRAQRFHAKQYGEIFTHGD